MIPRSACCFQHFQQQTLSYDDGKQSSSFAWNSILETFICLYWNVKCQTLSTLFRETSTNRPRPGRRRNSSRHWRHRNVRSNPAFFVSPSRYISIFFGLVFLLCGSVTASDARSGTLGNPLELRRLAGRGEILVDRSVPPTPRMRERRQETTSSGLPTDIFPSSSSTAQIAPDSTTRTSFPSQSTASQTSALATASPTAIQSPLPSPFDSSLGNNFTSLTCPTFFQNFLSNDSFTSCLPFSLLLQTSNSFFTAERSLVRLTETLDATCNVDFNTCNAVMSDLATQLTQNANCGADFKAQNPMVLQAYDGFLSYAVLYHAGCQKDTGGNYCR